MSQNLIILFCSRSDLANSLIVDNYLTAGIKYLKPRTMFAKAHPQGNLANVLVFAALIF